MQKMAIEAIEEILEFKAGSVEPCVAHISEIRNSLNVNLMESLRDLYRKGVITVQLDINKQPMFQLKQQ